MFQPADVIVGCRDNGLCVGKETRVRPELNGSRSWLVKYYHYFVPEEQKTIQFVLPNTMKPTGQAEKSRPNRNESVIQQTNQVMEMRQEFF